MNRNLVKINKKQEGNPLLKYFKFQCEFVEDLVEDYDIDEKVSVLFLQLSYHLAYPLYIVQRLENFYKHRRHRKHRILLLLNDNPDD